MNTFWSIIASAGLIVSSVTLIIVWLDRNIAKANQTKDWAKIRSWIDFIELLFISEATRAGQTQTIYDLRSDTGAIPGSKNLTDRVTFYIARGFQFTYAPEYRQLFVEWHSALGHDGFITIELDQPKEGQEKVVAANARALHTRFRVIPI